MISVIIPAYNVKEYIVTCIESVISIPDLEIIVVNDGSKEDLDFVWETFKNNSNFKYYKQENGGLSAARNFGIKKATKDYIMFLDGDDFLDTTKLIEAIDMIKSTRKDAYYFKRARYYEDIGKVMKQEEYAYTTKPYLSIYDQDFLKDPFGFISCRYIIKRELIKQNDLYFVKGIYHEDEEWVTRLFLTIDKIYAINSYIYYHRMREGSIMNSYRYKNITDVLIVIDKLLEYKNNLNDPVKRAFIDKKCAVLYRRIFLRMAMLELTNQQKMHLIKELEQKRRVISFDKQLKNQISKYLPVKGLLYLQKAKYKIKKCDKL